MNPPENDFRISALVISVALFMQNIDGTIVTIAIPSIARDLGISAIHLSSVIIAYLVALTVFTPISGWVADRFGAKRVFLWAIVTFTLASAGCALIRGLPELISFRILQGAGGAMMVPVGRLILFRGIDRENMLSASTWLTMPALLGPILGPPLGGFLTSEWSWRWTFWINLPIGILGLVCAWRFLPETQCMPSKRLDLTGSVLVAAALAISMIGFDSVDRGATHPVMPILVLSLGAGLCWLAWRHCRRTPDPAVDFSLLDIPTFKVASIAGGCFIAASDAMLFLVPLMLQVAFGYSVLSSSMMTFASSIGSFCMRPMAAFALRRYPVRSVLTTASCAFAVVLSLCALMSKDWSRVGIFFLLLMGGVSRSLNFATTGAIAFADVPESKMSAATSFQGTSQKFMKAFGVASVAATVQIVSMLHGDPHPDQRDIALGFVATVVMVMLTCPMFAQLSREDGSGVTSQME
ncbi:MFS transporter [Paraburkholderia oxyphila]|uniref:MFS transporter n=1 Tax=Paraburkholderia oxyphila TaxID=614212 RepID=UPI00048379A2|nr:MFS transporter [Paraburkholderia oxyphila]